MICEGRVQRRKISQCAGARAENEVVDGRDNLLSLFLPRIPASEYLRHVYVHAQIEMRCGLLALRHSLADDAAHRGELDHFFDFRRSSRSGGLAGCGPEHIFGKDAAARPASFEGCDIDASLFGDSFGRRRCEDTRTSKR